MAQDQHRGPTPEAPAPRPEAAAQPAPAFEAQPTGPAILSLVDGGRGSALSAGVATSGEARQPAPAGGAAGPPPWRAREPRPALQLRAARAGIQGRGGPSLSGAEAQGIAARGVEGAGGPLPHLDTIQASFGAHDVRGVKAHTGQAARDATSRLGAMAYATGQDVALSSTDLHTAAHEAAHVVQQRGGIQLKDGVGAPGDAWERHADAVADKVVQGESAEPLLDEVKGGEPAAGGAPAGVQMKTIGFEFQASNTHFYQKTAEGEGAEKPTYTLAQHNHAKYVEEPGLFKIESDGIEFELVTKPFEVEQLGEKFAAIKEKVQALETDTTSTSFKKIGRSGKAEDAKDATENLGATPLPLQPDKVPAYLGINDGGKIKAHPQATFGVPVEELPALYKKITEGPEKWDQLKVTDARAYVGAMKSAETGSAGVDGFLTLVASIIVTGEKAKAGTFHKDLAPLMPRTSLATIYGALSAEDKALCTVENLRKAIGRRGGTMDLGAKLHDPASDNHIFNEYTRQKFFDDILAGKATEVEGGSFGALKEGSLGDMEGISGPMDIGGGQKGVWVEHRRLQRGVGVADWGGVAAQVAGDLGAAHDEFEASKPKPEEKKPVAGKGPSREDKVRLQQATLASGRKDMAAATEMKLRPRNAAQASTADKKIAQAKLKIAQAKTALIALGEAVSDEVGDEGP